MKYAFRRPLENQNFFRLKNFVESQISENLTVLNLENIPINPLHSRGIPGNELADTAAKEATILQLSEPITPVPYQDITNNIKAAIKDEYTDLVDQDHIRNTINYLKEINMFNKI
ncbi:hypothetical protein ANTQUA_LOCUS4259 [Anthophora quadrimaculata]